jgi:glucosamine--fructose-6-phosphate aminotransferase (isomerizing)
VVSPEQAKACIAELTLVPGKLETLLTREEHCEELAKQYVHSQDFLFLGRGIHYPVALEGALKLKEVSYIHAEGYPAGEMKHGPNALIDENLPVVILATCDQNDPGSVVRYEKTLSNLKEVKARYGQLIALANQGDEEIAEAPTTCSLSRKHRRCSCPSSRSCPCSFSPTTSPYVASVTSTNRGIWPSQVTVE